MSETIGPDRKVRLCHIATVPMTFTKLFGHQLAHFRKLSYDITLVSSPGPELVEAGSLYGVRTVPIPMTRRISPLRDLISLARLVWFFSRNPFDIVHVHTPKAACLGSLAAWLTRQPTRFFTLRGLRYETTRGFKRRLLKTLEWVTGRCSQRVICISPSVRDQAIADGVLAARKAIVIGMGSSNGISPDRFLRTWASEQVVRGRRAVHLQPQAPVVGFAGRLSRDKGVADLYEAMVAVRRERADAQLLIVGDWDSADPVGGAVRASVETADWIAKVGFVSDPESYYGMMDVLAFPSYREGFGNTILEAAGSGVPCVAYRVTGVRDAIVDGQTGLLVELRDSAALANAILKLLGNEKVRQGMGEAGRQRVEREFSPSAIWAGIEKLYRENAAVDDSN